MQVAWRRRECCLAGAVLWRSRVPLCRGCCWWHPHSNPGTARARGGVREPPPVPFHQRTGGSWRVLPHTQCGCEMARKHARLPDFHREHTISQAGRWHLRWPIARRQRLHLPAVADDAIPVAIISSRSEVQHGTHHDKEYCWKVRQSHASWWVTGLLYWKECH